MASSKYSFSCLVRRCVNYDYHAFFIKSIGHLFSALVGFVGRFGIVFYSFLEAACVCVFTAPEKK